MAKWEIFISRLVSACCSFFSFFFIYFFLSTMSHPQDIHPFAQVDNEEYNMLISELNRQVVEHQPEDLLQFCTTFFLKKLEDERAESRQYDQHPLGKSMCAVVSRKS